MRSPRVSTVFGAAFACWGLGVGLLRLHDNSYLTHLATGRLILAHGVPTTDPYTFTAHGRPWVVESWLASVLFGVVDRVVGGHGLQVLHGALGAALGWIAWVLGRPARQLPGRIIATGGLLAVGSGYWTARPLVIALLLFGVLIAMTETGRGPPWLLVPLVWVWVQVHGSWPLALVYLGLRLAGRRADGVGPGRLPRLLGASALGVALGAANPLGPRLLTYPLTVLTHHQAFAHIAEWQSPSFSDPVNAAFLAALLLAFVLMVARGGTVEDVLVTAVFAAAAFEASRNVPVAILVLTPVLARGLTGLGQLEGGRGGLLPAAALAALVAVGGAMVAGAVHRPAFDLAAYPVTEVTWMQQHGLAPGRVATPDYVGNYLEFRFGTRASAFVDDRVDVFPPELERGYVVLLAGGDGWQAVLDRFRVTAVLWPRAQPLAGLVAEDPRWTVRLRDRHWIVAVRDSSTSRAGAPAGT